MEYYQSLPTHSFIWLIQSLLKSFLIHYGVMKWIWTNQNKLVRQIVVARCAQWQFSGNKYSSDSLVRRNPTFSSNLSSSGFFTWVWICNALCNHDLIRYPISFPWGRKRYILLIDWFKILYLDWIKHFALKFSCLSTYTNKNFCIHFQIAKACFPLLVSRERFSLVGLFHFLSPKPLVVSHMNYILFSGAYDPRAFLAPVELTVTKIYNFLDLTSRPHRQWWQISYI